MRNLKLMTLAAATAAFAGLGVLAPAANAGTSATFTVGAGTLTITEPSATASFGTPTASPLGTTATGSLGSTTITDGRGSLAGWTLSMASTDFTTTAPVHTITASNAVAYLTAVPTVASGVAVVTNTHVLAASGLTLGNSAAAFMTATTTGSNTVTFTPTIQVTIPSTAIAGVYNGTVTQTVA